MVYIQFVYTRRFVYFSIIQLFNYQNKLSVCLFKQKYKSTAIFNFKSIKLKVFINICSY